MKKIISIIYINMGIGDYLKPLGNLFGINPITSKSTAGFRKYADIRQKNNDRGFRNGKYYDYLDVEKGRKKNKSFTDKVDKFLKGNGKKVKKINYKANVKNKKGQKLTLIRPPLRNP